MYDTWPTAERQAANRHPTARVVVINCLEQHIDTLSVFFQGTCGSLSSPNFCLDCQLGVCLKKNKCRKIHQGLLDELIICWLFSWVFNLQAPNRVEL